MAQLNVNKRFANHTHNEILEKRAKVIPTNTAKSNKKSANLLRAYLVEKGENGEFETFTPVKLNEILEHFYLDARKSGGEMYRTSSLESFRYGLNRYLRAPPHLKLYDIIKDSDFYSSNECFKTACCELKAAGEGECVHYPVIPDCDLKKLYASIHLSPETPVGLQNKAQLDIRLYFCRRGMENFYEMTKESFAVRTDAGTQLKYVCKVRDELSKNRRESDKENYGGVMTELKNSPQCPVSSFEKYLTKLNPENNKLWQRPCDSFHDDQMIWYTKQPVGKDSLSSFMTRLSKTCSLSQVFTNHSLRATGTTILARNNFSPSQIMAVTGHKSVNSLSVYHRVSTNEKIAMGTTINQAVNSTSVALKNPRPSTSAAVPTIVGGMREGAPGGELDTIDLALLDELFSDDFGDTCISNQQTVSSSTVSDAGPRKYSFFTNCHIGKVEINIRK